MCLEGFLTSYFINSNTFQATALALVFSVMLFIFAVEIRVRDYNCTPASKATLC